MNPILIKSLCESGKVNLLSHWHWMMSLWRNICYINITVISLILFVFLKFSSLRFWNKLQFTLSQYSFRLASRIRVPIEINRAYPGQAERVWLNTAKDHKGPTKDPQRTAKEHYTGPQRIGNHERTARLATISFNLKKIILFIFFVILYFLCIFLWILEF